MPLDVSSYTQCYFREVQIQPELCTVHLIESSPKESSLLHSWKGSQAKFDFESEDSVANCCADAIQDALRLINLDTAIAVRPKKSIRELGQIRYPDISLLRSIDLATFVEVKVFHDDEFEDKSNAGQIWRYLRLLQQAGVQYPMVLLTTYAHVCLCWLREHHGNVIELLRSTSEQRRGSTDSAPSTPPSKRRCEDKDAVSRETTPCNSQCPVYDSDGVSTERCTDTNFDAAQPTTVENTASATPAILPSGLTLTLQPPATNTSSTSTAQIQHQTPENFQVMRTAPFQLAHIFRPGAAVEKKARTGVQKQPAAPERNEQVVVT